VNLAFAKGRLGMSCKNLKLQLVENIDSTNGHLLQQPIFMVSLTGLFMFYC